MAAEVWGRVSVPVCGIPGFQWLVVHLGLCSLFCTLFKPHQNLWEVCVSVFLLCRLQKVAAMEVVCLADVSWFA